MNKKGFTLIELLAVIVILAIIALIAVPVVLNMIENARKSAAKSSAYGYIQAIDDNNELATMNNNGMENIPNAIPDATDKPVAEININIKGKKPTSGKVTIQNGKVTSAELCINDYIVEYNDNIAEVTNSRCGGSSTPILQSTFGGTIDKTKQYSIANVEQEGLKGVVYLDPSDLSAKCTSTSTITTTPTGCKKFYIYDDSGDEYKMIMDRNTTAKIAYNTTTPYVAYENASIRVKVEEDTSGWEGNIRLITINEIATITNNTLPSNAQFYLDGSSVSGQGNSKYTWLFDYTNGCTNYGCNIADSSTFGYWTSSSVTNYPNRGCYVSRENYTNFNQYNVNRSDKLGIRPVITISKSQLQ